MKPLFRLLLFSPVLGCLAIGVGASVDVFRTHQAIDALQSGEVSAIDRAQTLLASGKVSQASLWIETANLVSSQSSKHDAVAIRLLDAALAKDANHPDAWALLSFLNTRRYGEYTEASDLALQKSIELCGYCDHALLRWRLTYVLQHWDAVSEPVRMQVFSGADFLRWWHLDYDYLGRLRRQSLERGIPFDAYRKKVGTHVRPNEV